MAETYCGKNCDRCSLRAELNCPGCMTGPGRSYGGDCNLAKCCREKGHESCDTCGFSTNCGTFQSRSQMAIWRKEKIESTNRQHEEMAERSQAIGKWFSILFWLVVPTVITGIMGNDRFMESAPNLYLMGNVLGTVVTIIYGSILIRLATYDETYRTAGICIIIAGIASILSCLIRFAGSSDLAKIFSLPGSVISLIGMYKEYKSHSAIVSGVNNNLSENWMQLWKWYLACMITIICDAFLAIIVPILAILVAILAAIGIVIISILKLVYLYQTSAAFKNYQG